MSEKVLGLDIGPNTIKAILLERKRRSGGQILATEMFTIDENGVNDSLKSIAENKVFSNVRCAVTMHMQEFLFRQVTLPFHEDNKIRRTLSFELEPLVPFTADEIIADYLPSGANKLLVAIATKNKIKEWVSMMEEKWPEVPLIGISPLTLASLVLEKQANTSTGMILDIGLNSINVVFYENKTIIDARCFDFGNRQNAALPDHLCSSEKREAEITNSNPENIDNTASCQKIFTELKHTIEFLKLNGTMKYNPVQVLLTGGGSMFKPLQKELEENSNLKAEIIDLSKLYQIEIDGDAKKNYLPQIMNIALAAALSQYSRTLSFNFRQNEFKIKTVYGDLRKQWKWFAAAASIALLMAAGNQYLDYSLQTSKMESIKKQISELFKRNYPEATAIIDPVSQLKTKLGESKKAYGFYDSGSDITVVDLLKDISSFVNSSVDIMVTGFSFENEVVLIKGEAKSIDAVSSVKKELLKGKHFKEVAIGSTNLAKQGGKVEFDLRITLK